MELVLCHVEKASIRALLEAHGVIASGEGQPGASLFASVDEGMQFVEEQYLKVRPADSERRRHTALRAARSRALMHGAACRVARFWR